MGKAKLNEMKKAIFTTCAVLVALYVLICCLLFVYQEDIIFLPQKLNNNHQFTFATPFEEVYIKTEDNVLLHGLLFKANQSKGLIFYLHGNAGSLNNWGKVAQTYTDLNYDVFMLDYRGYGKSEGSISSEEQLFDDVQTAYKELSKKYNENNIIVLGYSIGTGPAAKIATTNHPKLLILQAPYASLTDMMKHRFPIIPTFLLKYKLATNEYIKNCKTPIIDFHGDQDKVIPYEESLKLKPFFKPLDTLITLTGQGHNGMGNNSEYQKEIVRILQ